jgi:hypothetical protein
MTCKQIRQEGLYIYYAASELYLKPAKEAKPWEPCWDMPKDYQCLPLLLRRFCRHLTVPARSKWQFPGLCRVFPQLVTLNLGTDLTINLEMAHRNMTFQFAFWHIYDNGFSVSWDIGKYSIDPARMKAKISQMYNQDKQVTVYATFWVEEARTFTLFGRIKIGVYANLSTREILRCSPAFDTETLVKDLRESDRVTTLRSACATLTDTVQYSPLRSRLGNVERRARLVLGSVRCVLVVLPRD